MGPPFPFHLPFKELDLRQRPDLYRIAVGEQGMLEPDRVPQPYRTNSLVLVT